MSVQDDCYALLGLAAGADDNQIRRAWRRMALKWHPDRAGPGATAMFQRISAAYAVLCDPAARAKYDRAHPVPTKARAPGVLLSRLSGPLNALLASGAARRIAPGVIELTLNDSEAEEGGMAGISMQVQVRCADPGSGCPRCRGTGHAKELFSAWLAIRPGVSDGTVISPSAQLPGVLRPVSFQIRRRQRGTASRA